MVRRLQHAPITGLAAGSLAPLERLETMMFGSIHLGTVRGIPIGANWSVFLIAWLIAWGLAAQMLPSQVPGLSPVAYWLTGSLVAALFFASLLMHELAHAIVARREGLTVEGITLWLLGGVARMGGDARSPGAEARIAGVGPLTSLGLALAFGLVAIVVGATTSGEIGALALAAAQWLAVVNLILAIFNLLPGAPLDGGRIARAILWRWRGDKLAATRWSTGLGQAVGYGLVAIGLLEFVVGADLGGLWFVVLGIFLSSAAGAERRSVELTESLRGVRVAEVMTPDPLRVPGSLTVETFVAAALGEGRSSTWLLTGPGGIITGLLGVDRLRSVRGADRTTTRLEAVALPIADAVVTSRDEMVMDLLARLDGGQAPRAVVRSDGSPAGEIVGLVTPEDVARAIEMGKLRASGTADRARPVDGNGSEDPVRP
jgi:Zn-dependent protease